MANTFEKDGIEYCSICKEPLQHKYEINGEVRVVRVSCACAEKRRQEEEKQKTDAYRRQRIKDARDEAFSDKRLFDYTFANDDGENSMMLNASLNYVKLFDMLAKDGKGLMFLGGVGVGKTYYAACIANALIDSGHSVIFTNFAAIANSMFGGKDKQSFIEKLMRCDLLVLDDLASERDTEYMGEIVQMVIDRRYMNNMPIIVTTNLSRDEMVTTNNIRRQRVFSRLFEMCVPIEVKGNDKRRKKQAMEYDKLRKLLNIT